MINNVNSTGSTGAAASSSSADNTVGATQFQNAIAAQGGTQSASVDPFLSRIAGTTDPQEKRALIDGFAAGFAAAFAGGTSSASQAGGTSSTSHAGGATATQQTSGAQGGGTQSSAVALMQGYKALADQIADSNLPPAQKAAMLDNIAGQMALLRDNNPPASSNDRSSTNGNAATTENRAASDDSHATNNAGTANNSGSTSNAGTASNSGSATNAGTTNNAGGTSAAVVHDNASGTETPSRDSSNGVWTSEVKDGVAEIHLGNHYTLRIDEHDQSVMLVNNFTNQRTKVYGDPHMDFGNDGKVDIDFHKGMTFQLADGIKITLDTIGDGGDATFTTKLTITQGDKGMVVSGIAGDIDGKNNLSVQQSDDGAALDRRTLDGAFTFVEDEVNKTWKNPGGHAVTQQYVNDSEANWSADDKKKKQ